MTRGKKVHARSTLKMRDDLFVIQNFKCNYFPRQLQQPWASCTGGTSYVLFYCHISRNSNNEVVKWYNEIFSFVVIWCLLAVLLKLLIGFQTIA